MTKLTKWELVEKISGSARRILLHGPAGTGKTHCAVFYGTQDKEGVFPLTLHPDMPAAELKGHYIPVASDKGQEFKWHDGVAIAAARYAHKHGWARLVINEIDHAEEDVLSFLYVVLDDPQTAKVTLPTGEVINFPETLQIIGTMNGVPDDLLPALQDRFPVTVNITEAHPAAIASLPQDLQSAAKKLSSYLVTDRRASIRVFQEFAKLREKTDEHTAAFACFGDRANEFVNAIRLERAPS